MLGPPRPVLCSQDREPGPGFQEGSGGTWSFPEKACRLVPPPKRYMLRPFFKSSKCEHVNAEKKGHLIGRMNHHMSEHQLPQTPEGGQKDAFLQTFRDTKYTVTAPVCTLAMRKVSGVVS